MPAIREKSRVRRHPIRPAKPLATVPRRFPALFVFACPQKAPPKSAFNFNNLDAYCCCQACIRAAKRLGRGSPSRETRKACAPCPADAFHLRWPYLQDLLARLHVLCLQPGVLSRACSSNAFSSSRPAPEMSLGDSAMPKGRQNSVPCESRVSELPGVLPRLLIGAIKGRRCKDLLAMPTEEERCPCFTLQFRDVRIEIHRSRSFGHKLHMIIEISATDCGIVPLAPAVRSYPLRVYYRLAVQMRSVLPELSS